MLPGKNNMNGVYFKKFTNLKKNCDKFCFAEIMKNGEFKSNKKKLKLLL